MQGDDSCFLTFFAHAWLLLQDKHGNPLDLGAKKSSLAVAPATAPSVPHIPSATSVSKQTSDDAGAKLREAALARIAADSKAKFHNEDPKNLTDVDTTQPVAKQQSDDDAAEKAKTEDDAKEGTDDDVAVKAIAVEEDQKAKESTLTSSLQSLLITQVEEPVPAVLPVPPDVVEVPGPAVELTTTAKLAPFGKSVRKVYSKQELMKFKDLDMCLCRPTDLPDMTVERGQGRQARPQREGGSSSWSRGQPPPRRQSSNPELPPQGQQVQPRQKQWSRGQAPPPQPKNRGGRGGQHEPSDDFKPLVKSDNHWKPQKNTSRLVVAEKQVKSILNKMTKEKFEKLSQDMCQIPLESYDILVMIIKKVYEKAIDEPAFGDMYADLCCSLSHVSGSVSFVHIVESDEDVTEENKGKVYRWSNDVSTSDSEIVGPFETQGECEDAALSEEELPRIERGEMALELVSLQIRRGIFIKTMKRKDLESEFYTVYFPVSEAEECGQQLSEKFLSKAECVSDSSKQNSFKRSLLNKCEDEFNKQDIYADWKKEKAAYEHSKMDLEGGDRERKEKEEELEFRRIKIKKQMLGNIKFIGQLFKKGLLKEKIMRYCIGSLLKLKEDKTVKSKNPEYVDTGEMDMDDEDHEALCSMFATIGKVIDTKAAAGFMSVCFTKFERLGNYNALNSRSRFMYKDLLDLRHNGWVPRREEEKAKTIDEIRKEFDQDERNKAAESAKNSGGYRGGGGGGGRGGNDRTISGGNDRNTPVVSRRAIDNRDFRGRGSSEDRRSSGVNSNNAANRTRQAKPVETDDDGFTTIAPRGGAIPGTGILIETPSQGRLAPKKSPAAGRSRSPPKAPDNFAESTALSKVMFDRRVDSMKYEFMQDPSNIAELLLSMEELAGTPDAGFALVSRLADASMDCKDIERTAIVSLFVTLFENQKLTKDDVCRGLVDSIEFIDSFLLDSPRACEYLGEMLAPMLKLNAIDSAWLCARCENLDPNSSLAEQVIKNTIMSLKKRFGAEVAAAFLSNDGAAFESLLGVDKWTGINGGN